MKQIEEYYPVAVLQRYVSTVAEVEPSLVRAVESFVAELVTIEEERLHAPIGEGRWSPAEYADHLYRVTLLYVEGVESAARGEAAVEYQKGWVTDSGGLVSLPQGEPVAGRSLPELERDLRSSTTTLIAAVRQALADGATDRVSHVNPYFGPLTPLGCMQIATVHARHHSKHLAEVNQAAL